MTRPVYLAIEGVIGVGKTTLARLLRVEYEAALCLEAFDENPFLPLFYQDPERYAFQNQIFFLLSRFHQQQQISDRAGQEPVISDYLFDKDRLFARLTLQGDEWSTYEELHRVLAARVVAPDLVIYLRADVDTLMSRIALRGREYERNMSRDYIGRLAAEYDRYFREYDRAPLLVIETDDLHVPERAIDRAEICARVRTALSRGVGESARERPLSRQRAS